MPQEKQLMEQYLATFERIASALERIAHVMETAPPPATKPARGREEVAEAPTPVETEEQTLIRLLGLRNLTLAGVPPLNPPSKPEQDLVRFIGERYSRTQKLLHRLVSWPEHISGFYMHLKGEDQPAINDMIHVARHLQTLGLLKEVNYKGGPHFMLNAELGPEAASRHYFRLGWFLCYLMVEARRLLEAARKGNKVLSVSRLRLQHAETIFELPEPLVILNARELFWLGVGLEGPTGGGLEELKKLRLLLKLEPRNAWRVVLTEPEARQVEEAHEAGFTLVTLEQFSARFTTQVGGRPR